LSYLFLFTDKCSSIFFVQYTSLKKQTTELQKQKESNYELYNLYVTEKKIMDLAVKAAEQPSQKTTKQLKKVRQIKKK